MSVETERRVENLLARSKEARTTSDSGSTSSQTSKHDSWNSTETIKEDLSVSVTPKLELLKESEPDSAKKKLSVELRDLQISKKVTFSLSCKITRNTKILRVYYIHIVVCIPSFQYRMQNASFKKVTFVSTKYLFIPKPCL